MHYWKFLKLSEMEEVDDNTTVSRESVMQIYPHLCDKWQKRAAHALNSMENLFSDKITVPKQLLSLAKASVLPSQKLLVDWIDKNYSESIANYTISQCYLVPFNESWRPVYIINMAIKDSTIIGVCGVKSLDHGRFEIVGFETNIVSQFPMTSHITLLKDFN